MENSSDLTREERDHLAWQNARRMAPSDKAILERGGWWDIMPSEHARYRGLAERYCSRHDQFSEEARSRVREVWIEGKYRAAWEPRDASGEERRARLREALPGLGLAEENPL